MKFLAILFIAILCANASAQTVRTLGYNTTNGQVVANTTNTLTFTNATKVGAIRFSSANGVVSYDGANVLDFEEPSLLGGAWAVYGELTFANPSTTRANLGFSTNLNTLWTATNSSNARSAVGLGLPALTNTSNVTAIRALAGSTNSNHPFTGQFNVIDDNSITFTIVVSNGIIVSATEY